MEKKDEKNTQVQVQDIVMRSESGKLLQMAVEKDLDVEKLRVLMDLRDREERKKAEREFEEKFAEMQRDYIPAFKGSSVKTSTGKIAYSYCPLPGILSVYAPILARHGFSYRWEEEEVDGKLEKKTTCFLSGYGFSRQASISLPYGVQNNLINPIQARGATSEYGRRYTFMNVTGCIVADESDTDGKIEVGETHESKSEVHNQKQNNAPENKTERPTKLTETEKTKLSKMMQEMAWDAKKQKLVFDKAELAGAAKALEGVGKEYEKFTQQQIQKEVIANDLPY